jgi:hypothetical protein
LTVRVELPPAVTEDGVALAVVPVGAPLTERATVCALPDVTAVVMLAAAEPPCAADALAGLTAIEKSLGGGGARTVRVKLALWVALEPVPVMVSV